MQESLESLRATSTAPVGSMFITIAKRHEKLLRLDFINGSISGTARCWRLHFEGRYDLITYR